MISIDLKQLELPPFWQDEVPASRGAGTFPLVPFPEIEDLGAVYFELEPEHHLATHTDSQDEILVVLEGRGRAHVGEESVEVDTRSIVFVPAMAPHGIENTGEETLRVLGIFAGSEVDSTFLRVLQPYGTAELQIRPMETADA